jgi:hypothetical protein
MKKILLIICLIFSAIITSYSQLPSYVPSNGLISWYSFNGNANDLSGNGHNGTLINPNTQNYCRDRHKISNKAFVFENHSRVKISRNNSFYGIRTVSFWLTSDIISPPDNRPLGFIKIGLNFHIYSYHGSICYQFNTQNNTTSIKI